MDDGLKCPRCNSENAYHDGSLWVCPDCAHEWNPEAVASDSDGEASQGVRDAHGNLLNDGDAVTVIGIRLVDGADGHNISCRVDGIGAMNLKSEFVKKA